MLIKMNSSAQLMRQADTVKATLIDTSKALSELWSQRQKLEDLYKQLLLHDLEYALDKKVEQELWNHAFKNQISTLQNQAKDKASSKKMEARANLNLFLEMASGFYLQFLQMICSTFKLDLPFRRCSSAFGITNENKIMENNIVVPKKSSCLYICCHCLVHLGDIARYLQQTEQAQNYYRHAANLSPNNGQPYNQLAILEASRGDKLSTVFYYVRSLAVRHPFTVAATNLEKFYSKLIKDGREFDHPNMSMAEITVAFLQFQALLHMSTNFDRAAGLSSKIVSSLGSHIRALSLTAAHLTGIVAISIFALHRARHDTANSGELVKRAIMSKDEEKTVQLHLVFFVKLLETLVQCSPKEDSKVKESLTLPTIKVSFDWLSLNRDVLKGKEFSNTSLWQDLCKLLNTLQWLLNDSNKVADPEKYEETPLPEDTDLCCFQPLDKSYSKLSFTSPEKDDLSPACERDLRCHRIVAHGKWIAHDLASLNLIIYQPDKSIRNQFSTQKTFSQSESTPVVAGKSSRQNIALQTIKKKQLEKKAQEEQKTALLSPPDGRTRSSNNSSWTDSSPGSASGRQESSSSGSNSSGRQGGVIPVHHRGGTFKPNLPPRLSGKNKPAAAAPRIQKKAEDNSSTPTEVSTFNKVTCVSATTAKPSQTNTATSFSTVNNSTAVPPPILDSEVEYPSLSLDNYPVLGIQKSPTALIMPNPSTALSMSQGWQANPLVTPTSSTPKSNRASYDTAARKGTDSLAVRKGAVITSSAMPGEEGVMSSAGSSLSSFYPLSPHQGPSTSPRPYNDESVNEDLSSQKVFDDGARKMGMHSGNGASQGYTSMQGPIPFMSAGSLNQTARSVSQLLQQQQQQMQQHQQQQNDLLKKQQQQQQQQSQQFSSYPSQAMSNTAFFSQPQAGNGKYDVNQDFQHKLKMHQMQQLQQKSASGSQISGGGMSQMKSEIQDLAFYQRGLYPNSTMSGVPSSSYNPQGMTNPNQQQQQRMLHQQQQSHSARSLNEDSPVPTGLLYKNIPLAGSMRGNAMPPTGGNNSSHFNAMSGSGVPNKAVTNQMSGHVQGQQTANLAPSSSLGHGQKQPSTNQMQASQAIAQLLSLNRGGMGSDLYRPPNNYQMPSKPDLMGMQPPPSFLDPYPDRGFKSGGQHQHQSASSHQPSFLNTMMDPSFLQGTGEYSLFNNASSRNTVAMTNANSNNSSSGLMGNNSGNANNPAWTVNAAAAALNAGGPMGSSPRGRSVNHGQELNPSLQSLWQNSGPSPLERLLEQQRHQRHSEG